MTLIETAIETETQGRTPAAQEAQVECLASREVQVECLLVVILAAQAAVEIDKL